MQNRVTLKHGTQILNRNNKDFHTGFHVLTHLPLDKMAAISQTIFAYEFSLMESQYAILIQISLKFVPGGSIDNK